MPDIHPGSAIVERTHGREKDARLFCHVMACLDRSPDAARHRPKPRRGQSGSLVTSIMCVGRFVGCARICRWLSIAASPDPLCRTQARRTPSRLNDACTRCTAGLPRTQMYLRSTHSGRPSYGLADERGNGEYLAARAVASQ